MASIQEDGELLERTLTDSVLQQIARDILGIKADIADLRGQVMAGPVALNEDCRAQQCSYYRFYLPWRAASYHTGPTRDLLAHSVYHHAEAHMAEAQRLCRDNWNGATRGGVTTHHDEPCCRNAAAWERLLGVTG